MARLSGGIVFGTISILLLWVLLACQSSDGKINGLILDTDISSDSDDAGAVAVLHRLAVQQEREILAMMVSSGDPWGATTLRVLNSHFHRADIPIGVVSGAGVVHDSAYTKAVAAIGGHDEKVSAEEAVDLYRRILAAQSDHSVTVVTIGYLTNLQHLLLSPGGEDGSPSGLDLVRQKVGLLVCMGGEYPQGREWNFYQDPAATKYVVENWPTSIVYAGFELGKKVITGAGLRTLAETDPLRLSYQLHNNLKGRPSWDQIAVLYAAGDEKTRKQFFELSGPGTNRIDATGGNSWQTDPQGSQRYLLAKKSDSALAGLIEELMGGSR